MLRNDSFTMSWLILESPMVRSTKVIGTSTTLAAAYRPPREIDLKTVPLRGDLPQVHGSQRRGALGPESPCGVTDRHTEK